MIRWLDRHLEGAVAALLLAVIVGLIAMNVVARYVFQASQSWNEELVLWCFVWFVWMGVAYAFREAQHVEITLLRDLVDARTAQWLWKLSMVVSAVFLAVLAVQCTILMLSPFVREQVSVVLGLPVPLYYASAPVGAVFSVLRILQHLLRRTDTQPEGSLT